MYIMICVHKCLISDVRLTCSFSSLVLRKPVGGITSRKLSSPFTHLHLLCIETGFDMGVLLFTLAKQTLNVYINVYDKTFCTQSQIMLEKFTNFWQNLSAFVRRWKIRELFQHNLTLCAECFVRY